MGHSWKTFRLSYGTRSLTFTSFGTKFVLICLGLGIAAVNSGSNLLYLVVSMMLSLVLISGILSEQALSRLSVRRRVPDEVYADTPFTLRFSLENMKRRIPSFALAVSDINPGGGGSRGAFVLRLGPGEKGGGEVEVSVPRRGAWVSKGVEVATRFPFGLFRKVRRYPREETTTVYPRIRPLDRDQLEELAGSLGDTPADRKGHGAEFRSLREYHAVDEARLIHWKSSARLSTLMAKEFEAEEKRSVTVVFDNLAPGQADPGYAARFEEGLSLAASLVRHIMFEREMPAALLTRDRYIPGGAGHAHYIGVMEALAQAGPVAGEGTEGRLDDALTEGPCVLVAVDRRLGWGRDGASFSLVMEAGP